VLPVPDLGDLKGYQKLRSGKQEIIVSKPFGVYFNAKTFGDAEWQNAIKNHYAKSLAEQIGKHNNRLDEWRESLLKDKKTKR